MTSAQLILTFKMGLDKLDSLGLPNFEEDEILFILNQAQIRFVKQRYGDTNVKKFGFEEIQKRTEDLENLVRTATIIPLATDANNISSNAQFIVLPNDYMFPVLERANITYLDCTGKNTIVDECFVKPIQHNDYSNVIGNPYAKPSTGKVLRMMDNGKIELIHSTDTTISSYKLRYIKIPSLITTTDTSEINASMHDEICNEAIKIALEGIESQRTQTFIPIVQNTQE